MLAENTVCFSHRVWQRTFNKHRVFCGEVTSSHSFHDQQQYNYIGRIRKLMYTYKFCINKGTKRYTRFMVQSEAQDNRDSVHNMGDPDELYIITLTETKTLNNPINTTFSSSRLIFFVVVKKQQAELVTLYIVFFFLLLYIVLLGF